MPGSPRRNGNAARAGDRVGGGRAAQTFWLVTNAVAVQLADLRWKCIFALNDTSESTIQELSDFALPFAVRQDRRPSAPWKTSSRGCREQLRVPRYPEASCTV